MVEWICVVIVEMARRYILKEGLMGSPDGLDVGCERESQRSCRSLVPLAERGTAGRGVCCGEDQGLSCVRCQEKVEDRHLILGINSI